MSQGEVVVSVVYSFVQPIDHVFAVPVTNTKELLVKELTY